MVVVYVPPAKYREMDKKNSCSMIVDKGTCSTFFLNGEEHISAGAMGNGRGTGWVCIWGYRVCDLATYKDELTPLPYGEHFAEVDKGNRERSYAGMLLKTGKRPIVVLGPKLEFRLGEGGEQLSLF